jgi:PTH2 family peptidyl-tRNA hydrolase
MEKTEDGLSLKIPSGTSLADWLEGKFTKICVSVDSEEELVKIYEQALQSGIPCSIIKDAGLTEFGGVPTLTCCAIGPAWDEEVNKITGGLKLL